MRAFRLLVEPTLLLIVIVGIDVQNQRTEQRQRIEDQRDNSVDYRSLMIVG